MDVLLQGLGSIGFFASRAFRPAFVRALILRLGPHLPGLADTDLVRAVAGAPGWFTAWPTIALLGLLALGHANDASFRPFGPAETRQRIAKALSRLHRRIVKAGGRFDELPLERQHQARKRLKRPKTSSSLPLSWAPFSVPPRTVLLWWSKGKKSNPATSWVSSKP